MPWFLYHAFKQLFPTGRWFPFFTFMSGLGIAVGVALMYVASSVMGGFGHQIRQMIVDSEGEVQIQGRSGVVPDPDAVLELLRARPEVAGATPTAIGPVMMKRGAARTFPILRGVDLQSETGVLDLERFIIHGSLDALDDDTVIISVELANTSGARIGSEVTIYSPAMLEQFENDEIGLPQPLRVVGIFRIGHPQLDANMALSTLRRMQELYQLEDMVHRINVRLQPGLNEFEAAARLQEALPPGLVAITWFDAYEDFQNIVRFEKYMIFFLLAFIVGVAALSIMSSLTISVVRKTREIGLLNALGARRPELATSFCLQGFLLGVLGTLAGLGVGWLILHFRNEIVRTLARLTVSEEVFQRFYGFYELPAHTEPRDIVMIVVGSLIAATLAGLIPALRAAQLKPVEALRSE